MSTGSCCCNFSNTNYSLVLFCQKIMNLAIVVTETGWPTQRSSKQVASDKNAHCTLYKTADENNNHIHLEAFDVLWKGITGSEEDVYQVLILPSPATNASKQSLISK
ncbi:unnamed protein product [Albugo candida]|uniref:Uncharacterized protein n=1 Tax=Albugo candida TaxID=65357 RepID=A0A024G4R1_9STRA|nr:unnamed protein product [Albugo candida]|eukprot:CCI41533.1 unnamed protein product [Albugo candida]